MAFESDFLELLPDVITHSTVASLDGYGAATYSVTATSYSALVQYKQKLVRAMDGSEKISTAQAILNCTGVIGVDDKLTLPDGTSPPILGIERYSDSGGQHHTEVYFG